MKRRITTRGIVYDNGQLLCVKLTGYRNGIEADFWCTPGGGIDAGESLHDALTREFIEETGVTPTIGQLLFIQQYTDTSEEQLEFFFHITNPEDFHSIDLSATSHGAIEIAELAFVDPKSHHILPKFLSEISIEQAIQQGRTQIFSFL